MESKLSILRKIARATYILAVICLVTGIVLSMVNKPVSASTGTVDVTPTSQSGEEDFPVPDEEVESTEVPEFPNPEKTKPPIPVPPESFPTAEPGEEPDPGTDRPDFKGATPTPVSVNTGIGDKNPSLGEFSRAQKAKQSNGASINGLILKQVAQAEIEGGVSFTASDQSLCQYEDGWIDATVTVSLPEGVTATLVTSWYVVHPSELNPGGADDKHYSSSQVQDGDSATFAAWWPGVRAQDDVVEIHWGVALVYNGHVIDTGSLDYYWYDWVCQPPTVVAPTATELTPSDTPTPEPGDESTPTSEPSDESTPTSEPGDESTPTPDPGDETTPTPDPGVGSTPTQIPGVELTITSTPPSVQNPSPTPGGNIAVTPVSGEAVEIQKAEADLATLPAPLAASDNALLIPVTGADLTGWQFLPVDINGWQKLFINFGLIFLGMAFVLQGVINSRFK